MKFFLIHNFKQAGLKKNASRLKNFFKNFREPDIVKKNLYREIVRIPAIIGLRRNPQNHPSFHSGRL